MSIPEEQLETWSHQGSVTQSSSTYNSIKTVLEDSGTPYSGKSYSIFLQGSYGNSTNIYAESDVDIVIVLKSCFQKDLSSLSDDEKAAYKRLFNDATYTHVEFKNDVIDVLTDAYDSDVDVGKKAITIAAHGNRRKADVIAAIPFRRYKKFRSLKDQSYEEGICFYNSKGQRIVNYPKQHSQNLTYKHQNTNKWLKPTVRIFKNIRSKLVKEGYIADGIAPSYFLEGLLYNVPNDKFNTSYEDCFVNAINWIQGEANKSNLVCANEQYYLLRDNDSNCWSKDNCEEFINSAIDLWNNW